MSESRISSRKLLAILAGLLVLSLVVTGAYLLLAPRGTRVVVTVDGKEYGSYPLHRDRTVVISPADGRWHNTLRIENGTARIIESDCSNQICVKTPPLREDMIGLVVCLPHGLVVELRAES